MDLAMVLLFGVGYASIIFEEYLAFNKIGVSLLMAVSLWTIKALEYDFLPDISVACQIFDSVFQHCASNFLLKRSSFVQNEMCMAQCPSSF